MSMFLSSPARAVLAHAAAGGALVALLVASSAAPASAHSPAPVTSASHGASRLPSERQWRKDVAHAMKGSRAYLRGIVSVGDGSFAINLDIDNTSLATHYRPGSPVLAVRAFARFAHRNGMAVMFNTGRLRSDLKAARRLLHKAGFPVTQMCGRARSETLDQSKPRCRERFVSEGYTIVANVGNNRTDFSGVTDYGRAFRLPNYGGRLG